MNTLRTPHSALRTLLTLAALICAFSAAALPLGLRLGTRALVAAQTPAETPEERAYRIYAPNTAFEVTVTNGATFAFSKLTRLSGHASFTVDWGDGSSSEHAANGTASHVYAADGKFVVKISDDISSFSINANSKTFVTAALRWGDSVTDASLTYSWCTGLTGFVPRWGENIVNANSTYYNCSRLTGFVPPWTDKITNASLTYYICTGLTGTIPRWGENIVNASETYQTCSGLTGAWTDDPAELMPERITSHGNCVIWSSAALRALFYSDWGGTREKPADE